jgi:hypothetical protein
VATHISPGDAAHEASAAEDQGRPRSQTGSTLQLRQGHVTWCWWVLATGYVFIAFVMFDQIEEDTFIYFRTAANIANGAGYVFNVGGERIETGSSLAWQYLLAGAHFLSLDLVVFVKTAGLALGGTTLYLLLRIGSHLIATPILRIVAPLLLSISIPFYYWVQRGLETPLYTFSIALLAFFLIHDTLRRYWYLPTLLVAFSRSEGVIVVLGLLGFAYFEWGRVRRHVKGIGIVVALLLASEVWRFFYFHDLVPHAFYLKIHNFPGMGAASVRQFFWETGIWALALVAGVGLLHRNVWTRSLITLAILELPLFWWAYRTGAGTNNNRHLVPALPILYVLIGCGLDALVVRWPHLVHPVSFGGALHALWLTVKAPGLDLSVTPVANPFTATLGRVVADPSGHVESIGLILRGRPKPVVSEQDYGTDRITANSQYLVGDFLRRTYPKGVTIVYDQMGQTPWYAGLDKTFIDTFGLTYKATAFTLFNQHVGGNQNTLYAAYRDASERLIGMLEPQPARRWSTRQAVDHLFALNPDVFIFVSFQIGRYLPDGRYEFFPGLLGELVQDRRMEANYVRRDKWYLFFYERKDLAAKVRWDKTEYRIPGKADKLRH